MSSWLRWSSQLFVAVMVGYVGGIGDRTFAQVTPDNTLGQERSVVNPIDESNERIDGGAKRGANLFHSFREFNVGEGRGAYFSNPDGVENIFSRVTGSSRSEIFGTLGVLGEANLFLVNPNGILFGRNASLDVRGSFAATTANAVQFGEQGFFSATTPEVPQLLRVNPSAFLFNQVPAGAIVNRSFSQDSTGEIVGLQVPSGENLTLVGGEVRFEAGEATARGGNINIGGLGAAGTVTLNNDGSLSYPDELVKTNINLSDGAIIDVASEEGGSINLNARDVNLIGGSRIIGGLIATGIDLPNAEAGDININATNDVTLSGVNTATNLNSAIQNNVESEAVGNSGDVNIFARNLLVTNGAQIQTVVRRQNFRGQGLAAGNGNAGNVNINVLDSVTISGISDETVSLNGLEINAVSLINTSLESGAKGKAGAIAITTDSLFLKDGGQIISATDGIGDAGNITFKIGKEFSLDGGSQSIRLGIPAPAVSTIFSSVGAGAQGNGGVIDIQAQNLSLTNGAQILGITSQSDSLSELAAGTRNAGNINIDVEDTITISGISEVFDFAGFKISFPSLISSSLDNGAIGKSGTITIAASSLVLSNGGQILNSTFGKGDAGNITLNVENSIELDGVDLILTINEVFNPSQELSGGIFSAVEAGAEGNSGVIDIQARNLSLRDGAQIQTTVRQGNPQFGLAAGNGRAGNISIDVKDAVTISGVSEVFNVNGLVNSSSSLILSALDLGAAGQAGEISITSNSLSLDNGGQITASTVGKGNAGNITLDVSEDINLDGANGFFAQGNFFIASSGIFSTVEAGAEGNSGVIDIQARNLSLRDGAQIQTTVRQGNPQFGLAAGNGRAGNISIDVKDAVTISGVSEVFNVNGLVNSSPSLILSALDLGAAGQAGEISITSNSLSLDNGGQITASTVGKGNAGNITLDVSEDINLDGANGFFAQGNFFIASSGIFSTVEAGAEGNGGVIDIQARNLSLTNGGEVNASTFGQGDGGKLTIAANSVSLNQDSSIANASESSFNAGDSTLIVTHSLQATDSSISTSSIQSSGGNLTITAGGIKLQGDSDLTTNISSGKGSGGNIAIEADSVIAFDDSDIFASAPEGQGGNITLDTPVFFGSRFELAPEGTAPETLDGNDRVDIDASGAVASGAIDIPDVSFLQNSLSELPENAIDTETLVANSCVVLSGGQRGTFIITGAGGLPVRPGDAAVSPYPTGTVRTVPQQPSSRPWQKGDPIVEPTGTYRLANGKLVMSRECS